MMLFLVFAMLFSAHLTKGEPRGRYTRGVNEYDIVVPQKVTENGGFVSYYLPHFYNEARVRRGADTGKVHYVVPIEGHDRTLELLPTDDFHGPGLVIEHHENDARLSVGSVTFRRPRKLNCYYQGWVRDEPSSSAAITACSGLAGAINIGSNQYLIEPVEEGDTPTIGPEHKHILYKREHQKGIHNRSICGTKETFATAFEERMKWEEKYGKETEKTMLGEDDSNSQTIIHQNQRSKKWCTTCKPKPYLKCQSPHPPCEIERPLFLELAIVIGPRVAADKYLFQDMEQYINTIINIAVNHFQDSSLERPILIKLVRVITLGFLYEDLDPYRYEPEELLKRFCEWQTHFNPPREVHPNHHDFILFLVKFGECSGSMQGLTNMASVCRPDKACGIVSLEGLLTGHVVTHMIGHSMGADHDDENVSGCLPEEPDGTCYHMAKHICTRSTTWSICSRQCISKFTSTHAAWCMSDIPTAHDLTDPTLLPGQVYSAAEQCRINFEMDTYACLVGEFCKHLFCKINDNECVSTGEPPAQGTRCGPDQWCFNQRCVHRGSRPGATNGEWGIWSQWTPCTKTCGGGVQTANRACDSPAPSNGGRKCPGSWMKSRMCNIGACPDAGKGFLDQQCKNTNTKPYHGRKHEWLHFNQQVEDLQCVVMCINEKREVAIRAPLAIDGTFCKPGTKDVCIRGMCRPVGCDWVIGSKSKEDACGVCHGNGTECRVMQGYFTEQNFQGRMPFLKLPIGTSMILMRETRPSPCFFVIANSLNSTYYLNSDDAEERTFYAGAFTIQSTVGIYQLKANMERIFIKDRLKVPITVSVVCRNIERSIGILYQYALPEPISPDVKPHYTWEFLSWEKCPHSCGGAVQRAVAICVEAQGGEVEDSYCSADSRPLDRIRVCNPRPCKAKWWVGPWSECDCYMKDGIKTRMVMCAHLKAARSYYITIVTEEECLGEDKPFSEKPCDKDAESIFWSKKGERKKRDYMDLVPYSKKNDNYSVWDDTLDDSLATVNVRELFQALDPENVDDYVYLRKIGMSPKVWDKIQEKPKHADGRVRRRKSIITKNEIKSSDPKEKAKVQGNAMKHKTEPTKHQPVQKHSEQNEMKGEPHMATRNKLAEQIEEEKADPPKKSLLKHSEHEKVDKAETTSQVKNLKSPSTRSTEVYRIDSSRKSSSGRADSSKKSSSGRSTEAYRNDSWTRKGVNTVGKKEELPKKRSKPTEMNRKERLPSTNEPMRGTINGKIKHSKSPQLTEDSETVAPISNTEKIQTRKPKSFPTAHLPLEKKQKGFKTSTMVPQSKKPIAPSAKPMSDSEDSNEEITHRPRNILSTKDSTEAYKDKGLLASGITGNVRGDIVNEKYVVMVDDPPITTFVTTSSLVNHQQTNALTDGYSLITHDTTTMIDSSTSLTVPEVRIAPGLTPYPLYAKETPARSGKCWKMEMKHPRLNPTCNPQEEAVVQPAEDPPEWDFVNTSNVKIFVVPIHTTIRTIIQNDNEFVLMETLAKYPVADEMNMVEHRGDAARRKLKIAANKKGTTRSQVQD